MLTAIAYARYSSDNQSPLSTAAQFRAIREYAAVHDVTILHEYADEEYSASAFATETRPGFEELLREVTRGAYTGVDLILFHKLDRLTRNDYDLARLKHELRKRKLPTRIVYVEQPIPDGPEGILIEQIYLGVAAWYSANLSREVRKGMKEKALQGRHRGGPVAFGYRTTPDGRYEIVEAEAAVVRRIFALVAAGRGYGEVIDELNRAGTRTRRGRPFGKNSLNDILRNPKYGGLYVAGRYAAPPPGSLEQPELISLPGAVPAIVDEETWRRVQAILDARRTQRRPRPKSDARLFILTGRVYCGVCGSAMTGASYTSGRCKRSRYTAYRCVRRRQTKDCDNRDIKKDTLEGIVLDKIESVLGAKSTEAIDDLADRLIALHHERTQAGAEDAARLRAEVAALTSRINRLFEAIESGSLDHTVAGPRLTALTADKQRLEAQLAALSRRTSTELNRDLILAYLRETARTLADRSDPAACRRLIEQFVERVEVGTEEIRVDLRMAVQKPGTPGSGDSGVLYESNMVDLRVSVRQTRPHNQRAAAAMADR